MFNQARPGGNPAARVFGRLRVQLGGALLFGVGVPALILMSARADLGKETVFLTTVLGMMFAVFLSIHLVRNITLHPGIKSAYFVLPGTLIGFGVTFTVILFLRLDYSRVLFMASLLLTLIWLYIVYFMRSREPRLRVGVVPFGSCETLGSLPAISLVTLSTPLAGSGKFDALVADFRIDLPDEWEAFLADCALRGLPTFHIKQLQETLTGRVEIEHLSENSFGSLVPFMAYLRFRRVIDFSSALVLGVLLLPFLVVVAVLIRIDSAGPLLFRQLRVGYRGEPFLVTKFRTMKHARVEDDARIGAMTSDNDPRVTRFGRFLRRSRIDELPQIWNILKGEMSWIGPRPEAQVLSSWYESELPFYRYRHIVPPGLTGWAQVNQGHVADLDEVMKKLQYDFYYIKYFSPWLDALIIARTIQTILSGFGSR